MTDAASNAIQTTAICFAVAVAFYSVGSCMSSAVQDRNTPQIECIKQKGNWSSWNGCTFNSEIKK